MFLMLNRVSTPVSHSVDEAKMPCQHSVLLMDLISPSYLLVRSIPLKTSSLSDLTVSRSVICLMVRL